MSKKELIDIPVGCIGYINGKSYLSKFATVYNGEDKTCFDCDLHVPGSGCSGDRVVCYCPPRVFKEVKESTQEDDEDEMNPLSKTESLKYLAIFFSRLSIFIWLFWDLYKLIFK